LVRKYGEDDRSSSYSERGDQAHGIAEDMLRGVPPDPTAPEDLRLAAEEYVGVVKGLRHTANVEAELIEATIESQEIAEFGGTIDYAAIIKTADTLHGVLIDFKAGRGIPVEAANNPQLRAYCLLLLEAYPDLEEIKCVVCQPLLPGESCNSAVYSVTKTRAFRNKIEDARGCPDIKASRGACRWCPVARYCPVIRRLIVALSSVDPDSPEKGQLDAHMLGLVAELRPTLMRVIDHCLDDIAARLEAGEEIPGYSLEETFGRTQWKLNEMSTLYKLRRRGLPDKVSCVRKLKSPTQLIKAGFEPMIADLVERPSRGLKPVRLDDASDCCI
jgi:hypothetical protein